MTILVSGVESTVIDGNQLDRVFHIQSGARVEISQVKITGGRAQTGSNGGGILNRGRLTLTSCSISNNTAGKGSDGGINATGDGADGGGIYNEGELTIDHCRIDSNIAGRGVNGGEAMNGESGGFDKLVGGRDGTDGDEGGITDFRSDIVFTRHWNGGIGGDGGGIYISGILTMTVGVISNNASGDHGS